MPVLAAVSAEAVRAPTEKSLMGHLLWLRELADRGLLAGIAWVDTRDMLSDGLTKGSVDRYLIDQALAGKWVLQHAPKVWQSAIAQRRAQTDDPAQRRAPTNTPAHDDSATGTDATLDS